MKKGVILDLSPFAVLSDVVSVSYLFRGEGGVKFAYRDSRGEEREASFTGSKEECDNLYRRVKGFMTAKFGKGVRFFLLSEGS